MRFQIVLLAVLLGLWGFRMRRASFADPTVLVSLAVAIASIGLYAAVYLEPRYIAFAFVMICAVYAATSLTRGAAINGRSLHAAVLIAGALIVLFGLQATIREWREARQEGDRLLQGVYSQAVDSAGVQLAALYPRGAEVACLGDSACWTDPYWAHYDGALSRRAPSRDAKSSRRIRPLSTHCAAKAFGPSLRNSTERNHAPSPGVRLGRRPIFSICRFTAVLQLLYTESTVISGFFLKKKPPCTELNRAHELENGSSRGDAAP
jgi:hypothetical protein